MPGWKNSNRRNQLPADWEKIRERTFRRDGYRCTAIRADTGNRCPDRATDCDHVDQSRNWDHSDENLTSLCSWHHDRKSSAEGGRAKAARYAAKKRRHPGLLR
jgi:5-methylcytosine-specific restriction protein A